VEQDKYQGNDQTNGISDMPGPSTVPKKGIKRKDKGKEQAGGVCKKTKVHIETPIYTLNNDDMERI
jgi:hypothetical protein